MTKFAFETKPGCWVRIDQSRQGASGRLLQRSQQRVMTVGEGEKRGKGSRISGLVLEQGRWQQRFPGA